MDVIDLPESHFADAISLWDETGLTRPWNDPEADLRRALDGSSSAVLAVLGVEGTLLATAMVGHDGHRGWVYYLAVRADHQGTGLGRRLMDACEAWVSERGIPKIQLMVRATNHDVLSFYEALGYEPNPVAVLSRWLATDALNARSRPSPLGIIPDSAARLQALRTAFTRSSRRRPRRR